jgi:hypothetical protein
MRPSGGVYFAAFARRFDARDVEQVHTLSGACDSADSNRRSRDRRLAPMPDHDRGQIAPFYEFA